MEMLTPNVLRQDGTLGLLECDYSLSLPEDIQVEKQEGHRELFYQSQDVVRLSLVISWQVCTYPLVGSFCSGGQFLVLVPLRTPWTVLAAQITSSYTPNETKVFSIQWEQWARPRRWPIANSFSIHGTNRKS